MASNKGSRSKGSRSAKGAKQESRSPRGRKGGGRPPRGKSGGGSGSGKGSGRGGQTKARGLGGTQVEGRQSVRELLLAGRRRATEIFLGNEVERTGIIEDILGLAEEMRIPVRGVSRSKLDTISHTESAQGVVAMANQLPAEELSVLCRERDGRTPFLLAVDGVTDPGNLGALMRISECAGVTGVVMPKHRAVHITPTVTKTAAGAIEYLPMTLVGGLPTAITEMQASGVQVIGLDMAGDVAIHDLPRTTDGVCLVLGAEGKGLSNLVAKRCDRIASIPLYGQLASLNVASAGAIAAYEIARLRQPG